MLTPTFIKGYIVLQLERLMWKNSTDTYNDNALLKMWSSYVRLHWNYVILHVSVDYGAFIYSKLSDSWISCV